MTTKLFRDEFCRIVCTNIRKVHRASLGTPNGGSISNARATFSVVACLTTWGMVVCLFDEVGGRYGRDDATVFAHPTDASGCRCLGSKWDKKEFVQPLYTLLRNKWLDVPLAGYLGLFEATFIIYWPWQILQGKCWG